MSATVADEATGLRAQLDQMRAERDELRALVLDLSDGIDLVRVLADRDARAIGAEAYERGHRAGYERGARHLVDTAPHYEPNAPTLAELEMLRWGPGGREHFADPRPGDRTGDEVRADAAASWFTEGGQ